MLLSDLFESTSTLGNLEDVSARPITLCIFPGRFQPMHPGHFNTFKMLQRKFDHVLIATSDVTDGDKSPFNYNEKVKIACNMFGLSPTDFIQTNSPYSVERPLKHLNLAPENTLVTFAVGSKDIERFGPNNATQLTRKDGTPAFIQHYGSNMKTADKHGYVYYVPDQENASGIINASDFRKQMCEDDSTARKAFSDMYGGLNVRVYNFVRKRLLAQTKS